MNDPVPRIFVGIDWATQAHEVCVVDLEGARIAGRSFSHSGAGLSALVVWLDEHSDGHLDEVAVGIEIPHGAVVDILLERGCQVFSINPKQLDRFRDRFSPAGAKDDRLDALVLADSLRTDTQNRSYRRVAARRPQAIQLREWSRMRDENTEERVRLTNRIREQLLRYFPQFVELFGEQFDRSWVITLWEHIRTPARSTRVRASSVERILKKSRVRRYTAEKVLEVLRQQPLELAPGTESAAVAHVEFLVERLRVVSRQIGQCEGRIEEILRDEREGESAEEEKKEQRSDASILSSLPGVGSMVLAALLTEASQAIAERNYHVLRSLSGVAPVTAQTGKERQGTRRQPKVKMRRACSPRLRQALYHWSRVAFQRDPASLKFYRAARARGKSHGRALRGLGDRLLRVACSMLRHGELYDPERRGLSSSGSSEGTAA